jgi:hypothetical protein
MEFETIIFFSDQVIQYVQKVTSEERSTKIIDFLSQRTLIWDLVRIPIQLDALYFAWDDLSNEEPQTMTDLYRDIELGLWKKDAYRLGII